MKYRKEFVTNSSSSSFIVISSDSNYLMNKGFAKGKYLEVFSSGKSQFGWEVEDSYDAMSKINFAYLQTLYIRDSELRDKWQSMLKDVISAYAGYYDIDFPDYDVRSYDYDYYIDHQSNASEFENVEMFKNERALVDFLFNKRSHIHTDNDNH